MAKILLVEDDQDIADTVAASLTANLYTVEVANDGQAGWERLRLGEYDLIILDINLPYIGGIEICRRFRSGGGITPILMLTARGAISEKELGFDAGADDYLTKPFNIRELSARVKALLRRPPSIQSSVISARSITLDSKNHTVTNAGKPVELSPIDFAVLEFLMRRTEEVFTVDVLITRVWNTDKEVGPDAVRSSIKRLRQALDTDPENSIIENIHKIGYRLRSDS